METNDRVDEKLIKHLVDRFLGWRLPKDFKPDGGIMFMDVYDNGTEQGGKFEPVGTNLFTAEQAKEMFRFLLENEDGTSFLEAHEREVGKKLEEIMRVDIGDASPTRLALQAYLNTLPEAKQ